MGLRKGQKELVENYKSGYCAVPAIPGGGKTYCLTMWATETILSGLHKPGKLLIVTYMNSAVNNFRQRISEELLRRGYNGRKDYCVSTIHGLCLQIIKERPDLVNAGEDIEVVDEVTRARLVAASVEEWTALNGERFAAFLEESSAGGSGSDRLFKLWKEKLAGIVGQTAVSSFKLRGIDPLKTPGLFAGIPEDSLLACAAEIYSIYDNMLKMQGYLDFDDMLHNAEKLLLEDETLLERYRKKYTFVCEDEAQDSNPVQNKILSMIADGNLLRVGDSNQAICGTFTNSDFRYFRDFCLKPGTVVYNITQSSRSSLDIIDLANYFVDMVRKWHPVAACRECLLPQYIEPAGSEGPFCNPEAPKNGINTAILGSWEEEAQTVVNQVWKMLKTLTDKTMAILVPTAWRMELIINLLKAREIPFEVMDNSLGERSRILKKLGRILDFIAHPHSTEKLLSALHECFPSEFPEELPQELSGMTVKDIFYNSAVTNESDDNSKVLKEGFSVMKAVLEYPFELPEKLILFIAETLHFDREEKAVALRVADEIRRMAARDPGWHIGTLASELLTPRNIFTHFTGLIWELKGYVPQPGRVTVSTYHKAKGLEWDAVFLTGLNNSDFPVRLSDKFIGEYWFLKPKYRNPQAAFKAELSKVLEGNELGNPALDSKLETIEERARLLYVGITRARQYLYLSGFHQNPGKRNEVQPSAYLLGLKKYLAIREEKRGAK